MNVLNTLLLANAAKAAVDIPGYMVVLIGLGTVFVGLICIILICKLLGYLCNRGSKPTEESPVSAVAVPAAPQKAVIENRGEVVAAIAAAVAEELGTDVSAIRIVSIKQV